MNIDNYINALCKELGCQRSDIANHHKVSERNFTLVVFLDTRELASVEAEAEDTREYAAENADRLLRHRHSLGDLAFVALVRSKRYASPDSHRIELHFLVESRLYDLRLQDYKRTALKRAKGRRRNYSSMIKNQIENPRTGSVRWDYVRALEVERAKWDYKAEQIEHEVSIEDIEELLESDPHFSQVKKYLSKKWHAWKAEQSAARLNQPVSVAFDE